MEAPNPNSTSPGRLSALAAAIALLGAACGTGPENVPAQGPESQASADRAPPAGGQAGVRQNAAVIDELLHDVSVSSSSRPGAVELPPASPAPPAEASAGASSPQASGDELDTFDEDMARIQQTVPSWDNGTGVTVKFLKESTGGRLSLIFVDPTPPVFQQKQGLWMIQGRATAKHQTLGHIVVLLKTLAPGRYEGSSTKKDVVVAVLMGEQWDGRDPETTWSINEGSWAELTLREGRNPGDLEGDFRGRLVDNQGTGYHTIEAGYIYVNR
jgi:hypothetical protein